MKKSIVLTNKSQNFTLMIIFSSDFRLRSARADYVQSWQISIKKTEEPKFLEKLSSREMSFKPGYTFFPLHLFFWLKPK